MEEEAEQRRRKVQAGKAKLDSFRQRKAKGKGSQTQKKKKKRKDSLVCKNDIPTAESTLETVKNPLEELATAGITQAKTHLQCGSLDISEFQESMFASDDHLQHIASGHSEDILELQENLNLETISHNRQEELETALQDRDDIITQLSTNLQQALQSREEMEEEAMLVSNKIHAMQLQLQDASEILRCKSPGKSDLYKAQQQISIIQRNLTQQTTHMNRIDKRAQDLEKELEKSRKATKDKETQVAKLEEFVQEQEKKLSVLQEKLKASEISITEITSLQTEPTSENLEGFAYGCVFDRGEPFAFSSVEECVKSLSAVIYDLKEKLRESETLRENLHNKLEEQMLQFQNERSHWEQSHADTVKSLTIQLELAEEQAKETATKDKQDKERLNEELRDLKEKLKLETENSQNLKLQHDKELQMYIEKLQHLEDDRDKVHQEWPTTRTENVDGNLRVEQESAARLLHHDVTMDNFRHELADLKKSLNRVKARKEEENCKVAQLHEGREDDELDYLSDIASMEKYLIPTCRQEVFDQSGDRQDVFDQSGDRQEMFDQSDDLQDASRIELDSDFILERSLDSTLEGNINLLCSPMPITNVLAGGALIGTLLDPESFAVYLSSNQMSPEVRSNLSNLSEEDLLQRCVLLKQQLYDKEQQLQKSSDNLEEALGKWREVTAELRATQMELERERIINKNDFEVHKQIMDECPREQTAHKHEVEKEQDQMPSIEELCHEREQLKHTLLSGEESLSKLLVENNLLQESLDKAHTLNNKLELDIVQLSQTLQESEKGRESDRQEFDNKLNSKGMEQQLLHVTIKEKEAEFYEREKSLHEQLNALKEMIAELENRLQTESDVLNKKFQRDVEVSEGKWREQVDSIKQEHEGEMSMLRASHQDELLRVQSDLHAEKGLLEELEQQLDASHHSLVQQTQSAHHLELEALRLSLTNMHSAHLELSQTNLQKEKENALVQLREALNDKRAQEVAILQGRHQFELQQFQNQHSEELARVQDQHFQNLQQLREDHSQEKLQLQEKHQQVTDQLQDAHTLEIVQMQELHSKEMERLTEEHIQKKKEWESQAKQRHQQEIAHVKEAIVMEISVQHEDALKNLQVLLEEEQMRCFELTSQETILQTELDQLREMIQTISTSKDQEDSSPTTLYSEQDDEQMSYSSTLEQGPDDCEKPRVEDRHPQMLRKLQSGYHEENDLSNEGIQLFWSQLDSNRASRQELHELKEQLLARSAQVEEIKKLKKEFEDQKLLIKTEHEREMEELRIYFEQKSRVSEESFREELEILHQRLQEMNDDDREELDSPHSPALPLVLVSESDQFDLLQQLTDQLEHHKEEISFLRLHSEEKHKQELDDIHGALTLLYKEDVLNMKMELSDRYRSEIDVLKKKHSLELEQLRARLSEEHVREIKLHLQSARQSGLVESQDDYPDELCIYTINKPVIETETSSEVKTANQLDEPLTAMLDKRDQFCQTEPLPNVQSSELSTKDHLRGVEEQGNSEVSGIHLQELLVHCDSKLESLENHTFGKLAEPTTWLQPELDSARTDTQNKFLQQLDEDLEKQESLLRDLQKENLSEEYVKEDRHLLTGIHKQEEELSDLSELQCPYRKELGSPGVHIQYEGEPGSYVSELQRRHEEELNACVSELQRQHQEEIKTLISEHEEEIQNLETSHLSKLDTLESSYLTEIQKIRDEHTLALADVELCLSERLQEKDKEMQDRLAQAEAQWLERHEQTLHQSQELLRKELAAIHIEKFQAMSKELEAAHMADVSEKLSQLRSQLEAEKNQALDALREEVLQMEEQNRLVLQELQDLHRAQVYEESLEQSQKLQTELNRLKEELQKQELLISDLNSELQDKCDHQQQLQEEMELLKCQSEMLLEQQVTQLKDEYEVLKSTAVQEKEEQLNIEVEKMRTSHQLEIERLTEQLQEKGKLVLNLQERVSVLTKEMETSETQLDVLVQRRERENQESDNLVAMLRTDAQNSQQELKKLQDSCQRLLKVFTEVLKSSLSIEDLISKNISVCLDKTLLPNDIDDSMDTTTKPWGISVQCKDRELPDNDDKHRASPDCDTMTEHSLMSSDEGCEVSEYLCDSVLGGLEVGLENEEKILQISQRLRAAVERLLEMVNGSEIQIEQTREMQTRFQVEFRSRNQEMAMVVNQSQDLLKRLVEETEAKNKLQVELHKAQGLIEGYAVEKASLEEELSRKEGAERHLVMELEKSQEQLKILTKEPAISKEQREVLTRLQEILSGNVENIEVELLKETERLAKDKLELQCQAKKDQSNLLSQMKVLEMELEEQMSRNQELMKKTSDMSDLKQQIQSLEKQLKNQRQFMDEQAVEREHERDDFQQEIQKLEEQLKQTLKNQGEFRAYGVENLEAQVKEKADNCNALLQGKDDLEQQIAERNEEIDKMLLRIQELEQAALSNAEAAKQCGQLEAELQKMRNVEKELLQDKEALQQQQYNNVLQISALQSKLDEARHRVPVEGDSDSILKEEFQAEREALHRKEKEAESLAEQLEQFREALVNKTEEILQLSMQLEIQRKQHDLAVRQAEMECVQLKDELSSLQQQREQYRANSSLQLPQALLQEKNQEIDHLNEQLLRLKQEQKAVMSQDAEVEELASLVEHLRSDQERLQKDKEEEVEQLHEVIEKLQKELEQLGPNRHEVSDSQESLDQLGLGDAGNLQKELRKGLQQPHMGYLTDLDQGPTLRMEFQQLEFKETHVDAELEVRKQLEDKEALYNAEIEVLEENLRNLQESNRLQTQELSHLDMQLTSLQEENELLRNRVSDRDAELAALSLKVQEMQDFLRERESSLVEKDLLVQTLQEQRAADLLELENQLTQRGILLEEQTVESQELQKSNVSLNELLEKFSSELDDREKKYMEEIQDLKDHLQKSEKKVESLTEEIQKLKAKTFNPSVMDALKEELNAAKHFASSREAELHNAENLLAKMRCELEQVHAECKHKEERSQQILQQIKKQSICMAELQPHSDNLEAEKQKQPDVSEQQQTQEDRMNNLYDLSAFLKPRSFTESLTDMSAWDSPDMVRKQEQNHSLRVFTPFSDISIECTNERNLIPSKTSVQLTLPNQHDHLESSTPSLSGSNYSIPISNDTHRSSLVGDTQYAVTEYDSCEDPRSEIERHHELSDKHYYKSEDNFNPQLDRKGFFLHREQIVNTMNKQDLPEQLQSMLNMVHEESCKILALSERPVVQMPCEECSEHTLQRELWHQEKLNLHEAIHTLRGALTQAIGKDEKDSSHGSSDWRRELLQSVQVLLESEMEYLRLEMKAHFCQHASEDKTSLSQKMELMMKAQEEQKRLVLEHLLASDRSSLLSEIKDLRSQLRMAHLQNQEKLQHLQESLTKTEERGSTKEHQLRRQVELLEYKLQQESSISEDLKASLAHERERASEQHRQLLLEQGSVSQLRAEQEEMLMEQEKLIQSQKELQKEISKLREQLERSEQAIQALKTQQELENKKADEEKIMMKQRAELREKCIQDTSASLDEQRAQNNKLSAALSQEQSCSANLRRDLQIEQSRFEALLSQERSKVSQAEDELAKLRQHSQSLSSTLTHERNTLEELKHQHNRELSRKEQERRQEHNLVLELQNQLKEERHGARELASMIEKTQHQAVSVKRQMEADIQVTREETLKEREESIKMRAMLETLQTQKQQLDSSLEQQRERESRLQKERDQYQAQLLMLQEEKRILEKERENERKRNQEAKANKEREEEWQRRIQDLQLQHERDQRRIQELQHMLAVLEEQERALSSRKSRLWTDSYSPSRNVTNFTSSTEHSHKLENIWQQLFRAVLQVKKWVQNKHSTLVCSPVEEEVMSLLETLSELKSEIQLQYVQSQAKSSPSVIDVLRSENEELTKSLTLLTKEKLELRSQLTQLRKTLQQSPQRGLDEEQIRTYDAVDSRLESERAAWQREKRLLQIALKHAESELSRVTAENKQVPDVSNSKVQRIYRKYLRAESFRKALVYQKKYLLLLLGGFQACEKATLSLIARMGVYPSPADVQVPNSHRPGLTKFRSAVRVVIAISRLKFLVNKWNKIYRKSNNGEAGKHSSALLQQVSSRMDVLQPLGSNLLNSPPTRDMPLCLRLSPATIGVSPRQPLWTQNRLNHSNTSERLSYPTQDPEHSITEYIKHLEMVQQKLGGL
ncbi:pericentrin isoform X2 [Pelobates fuscus]|uniref:pericentrin isoform X2 n=1 Tax=Pelobates fuscus TaxID=191477 RepID=UPI002FE4D73C